ncbi:MAG: hypothetical protein KGL74_11220 [Elusimicrobia bacterium]|nr:hypothetical protein [Elusimicrobiota bacterium]MDE2511681.1 hypothetical protein [Elusimicrobiota bacterium]
MGPRPGSFWKCSLALALGVCLPPRPARAWSANGHKTVALIAESRLSDATKAAVAAILGPTATLDAIAPCADDIRGRSGFDCAGLQLNAEPQSQPWHFVDAPITASPADAAALEEYCPNGACVVDQIRAAVRTLESPGPAIDANQKQVALMFLVHFVGDVHQPLHCANEIVNGASDRGGNLKGVVFEGTPLNLHALWDHQIQATDANDPAATSARLIADLRGKDVGSWLTGDYAATAALESFEIAKDTVYPDYDSEDPKALGADYQSRMQPIVDERLERAGVRLAGLLEQALGPVPPVSVAKLAPAPPIPAATAVRASFDGVSPK